MASNVKQEQEKENVWKKFLECNMNDRHVNVMGADSQKSEVNIFQSPNVDGQLT